MFDYWCFNMFDWGRGIILLSYFWSAKIFVKNCLVSEKVRYYEVKSLAPTLHFPKFPFPSLSANLPSIFPFPTFPLPIFVFTFPFPTFPLHYLSPSLPVHFPPYLSAFPILPHPSVFCCFPSPFTFLFSPFHFLSPFPSSFPSLFLLLFFFFLLLPLYFST